MANPGILTGKAIGVRELSMRCGDTRSLLLREGLRVQETGGQDRVPGWRPAPQIATRDDILHCFRLLLGRVPNPEEWRGHLNQVGEPLGPIVAGYLNSLEFASRGLLCRAETGIILAALEGFAIYADPRDAAVGYGVSAGSYEPEVTAVFRRLLRPGMTVIDIGANIGYFSMLSASLVGAAGHVLAIEPNPRNARLAEASRRENGFEQITVCQMAAGRAAGLLVLHSTHSNGTTSAPPRDPRALLGADTVPCIAVDTLVPADRRVDFIKLDVEGAEYNALLGCRRIIEQDRPVILTEFSPTLMPGISGIDGPEFLRWLIARNHAISVIRPDGGCLETGADWQRVMAEYAARGTDHLDLVAIPL